MQTLPLDATDQDFMDVVEEWVAILAQDRYQEASEYLYHPPSSIWSPEQLAQTIANYGDAEPHWSGKTFHVVLSSADDLDDLPFDEEAVRRFDDAEPVDPETGYRVVAEVLYAPLLDDGTGAVSSGLTAVVDFLDLGGYLAPMLVMFHVL